MRRLDCQVETFLPSPGPGVGVLAATYYNSLHGKTLESLHWHISRSDTADVSYVRRSRDNGRSWSEPELRPTRFEETGGTRRRHPRGGYMDPGSGRYVQVWTEGILPNDEPIEGMRNWVLFYAVAATGDVPAIAEQIVQDGAEFDAGHPLPGVNVGRNCVMIGDLTCRPLTLADGEILWPVQSTPTDANGDYWNPGPSFTYTDALVLHARWRPDGRLAWRAGDRVKGDPDRSTRGMIEPTLAELPDGRILMVMRGSNDGRPELPGHKWFSLSTDRGWTWSTPEPWTFTDGRPFFSPSACSQLLPHSNGKLYWLGNVGDHNPRGNSPRYPMVLAEVDPATGLLRRESLGIVDDRRPGESSRLTLSNFCAREDRGSGDIVLHMTRFFATQPEAGPPDWTAAALVYRIRPGNCTERSTS